MRCESVTCAARLRRFFNLPPPSTHQVTLSSLNRHALATRSDVGHPKATSLAAAFARIMPEAALDVRVAMFSAGNADYLLAPAHDGTPPSYVVDAIDNILTKVDLLRECEARGLPIICATGAGAKADPTRVRLVNLASPAARGSDPLARAVRARLKAKGGHPEAVLAVVSDEPGRVGLVDPGPSDADAAASGNGTAATTTTTTTINPEDYRTVPGFRVRTLPVLGPTPAAFGAAAASAVVADLAGAPIEFPPPPAPRSAPQYGVLLSRLADREERLHGALPAVDVDDVALLVRDVWRGVSAASPPVRLPGGDCGLASSTAGLTLTRWRRDLPAAVDNLVLLTAGEADVHDEGGEVGDAAFCVRVEAALARVAADCGPGELAA